MPGCGHAERALQVSWWQEHGAAHAGGPRAQQAGKLETRALFAGSQGGTVAPAGGNTYAPRSVRLDLKAPRSRGRILDHTGPSISPDRLASMAMARSPRASARGVQGAVRSHRRALKSIEAVKIRRIGGSEWMWRLAVGAESATRCTKNPSKRPARKPKATRHFGCPISCIENRLIVGTTHGILSLPNWES